MLDAEKLNDYIRKLAKASEMMHDSAGRPNI